MSTPKKGKATKMIQQDATLHESTVKSAEKHIPQRRQSRGPHRGSRGSNPAIIIKVDPAVMEEAKRLAGGDMSRVRILSATEVVVENPRR